MWKLAWYRTALGVTAFCVLAVAVMAAQARPSVQEQGASTAELLAEIRALRVDLNQRLDASIRAQLMVARVQLQEQRISSLSRQLSDVHNQLQGNERGRAPLEAQLKMFEAGQANQTDEEKKEAAFVFGPLRSQIEAMTAADEDLKRQQVYLSGLLAEEQSRWTAFNAQLEELERALAPKSPRRQR